MEYSVLFCLKRSAAVQTTEATMGTDSGNSTNPPTPAEEDPEPEPSDEPDITPMPSFSDVAEGDWYFDFVSTVYQKKLFAGFEMRNITGFDIQFFTGTRVFGNPRRTATNGKRTKAAELNTLAGGQSINHTVKNHLNDAVDFLNRQAGVLFCNSFN